MRDDGNLKHAGEKETREDDAKENKQKKLSKMRLVRHQEAIWDLSQMKILSIEIDHHLS